MQKFFLARSLLDVFFIVENGIQNWFLLKLKEKFKSPSFELFIRTLLKVKNYTTEKKIKQIDCWLQESKFARMKN